MKTEQPYLPSIILGSVYRTPTPTMYHSMRLFIEHPLLPSIILGSVYRTATLAKYHPRVCSELS